MPDIVISGTGLFTPAESISNEELVTSFNAYADNFNVEQAEQIAAGTVAAMQQSSAEFVEKASGIKSRYVMNKDGIIDSKRMAPRLPERPNEAQSIQCEMGVAAAQEAMRQAGKTAVDIDSVIVAASNMQRPYPAIAVEIQDALGIKGYGFDMNVACSSATFGIQQARDAVRAGSARSVLIINPEICSGHLNFLDRDSHFIFGATDKLFMQEGRKVFKEVCPAVAAQISGQLESLGISPDQLKRLWLHQANLSMNQLISKRVLGRDASADEAPIILDEYANTSSAGSIIAFHKHRADLSSGDLGVLCSFGAGYSIGSLILKKV